MKRENRASGIKCLKETRKFINAAKKFGGEVEVLEASGTWSVLGIPIKLEGTMPMAQPCGWKFMTTDNTERARLRPTDESWVRVVMRFE